MPPATLATAQARLRDALTLVEQHRDRARRHEELHPALLEQYGLATALRWHGEELPTYRHRLPVRGQRALPRLRGQVETTCSASSRKR